MVAIPLGSIEAVDASEMLWTLELCSSYRGLMGQLWGLIT